MIAAPVPSNLAIGDFSYAGGLHLTSRQTGRLHGLSDLVVAGNGTLTAVGDEGIFLEARLLFDAAERLVGVTDTRLALLRGEDGQPLSSKAEADAEGNRSDSQRTLLLAFDWRPR